MIYHVVATNFEVVPTSEPNSWWSDPLDTNLLNHACWVTLQTRIPS